MPAHETKLTGVDFRRLQMDIQARLKDLGTSVVSHRQKVRKQQSKTILDKHDARSFRQEVKKILSRKIKRLESNPRREILDQIFGLMAGYFISISGHRKGVLQNMLVTEVLEAEFEEENGIIEVKSHKSASTYGYAQLSVTAKEYEWFTAVLDLRGKFPGGDSPYFFFNRAGGCCRRLLELFQTEWTRLGFGGRYTFKNLRTSVVHHTKNISPKKKQRIHRAMCHSDDVAARFYTTQNTASEAAEVRKLQAPDTDSPDPPRSSAASAASSSVPPAAASSSASAAAARWSPSPEDKRHRVKSKRRLFVASSSEEEDEFIGDLGNFSDVSNASSESIPIQTSGICYVQGTANSPPRDLFILKTPKKSMESISNYHLIGQDPSPGHSYLGRPVKVADGDLALLRSSPRVKLGRLDEKRIPRFPLCPLSYGKQDSTSEEEDNVEEMVVEPKTCIQNMHFRNP
ncbi:uncharacterized protein LOC125780445 [Astyanax mexicanus]|uniref:uncharacterized protein LOC125780445 n=1 Tax=Astyanax mexicanus TaxID=7994 RepID=UPI0020CB4117|nr:uncharacterized protein LOC125780445 [Astyanax mexicanus]